jgi:hypothetical protein
LLYRHHRQRRGPPQITERVRDPSAADGLTEQWVNDEWDTLVGVGNDRIRDYYQRANALKGQLPTIATRERKAAKKAARKRTAREVTTIAKAIVSFGQRK